MARIFLERERAGFIGVSQGTFIDPWVQLWSDESQHFGLGPPTTEYIVAESVAFFGAYLIWND